VFERDDMLFGNPLGLSKKCATI